MCSEHQEDAFVHCPNMSCRERNDRLATALLTGHLSRRCIVSIKWFEDREVWSIMFRRTS